MISVRDIEYAMKLLVGSSGELVQWAINDGKLACQGLHILMSRCVCINDIIIDRHSFIRLWFCISEQSYWMELGDRFIFQLTTTCDSVSKQHWQLNSA